jgi:hypothetical protein
MSFLKALFNLGNSTGTRETVKLLYDQGLQLANQGKAEVEFKHPESYALFYAAKQRLPGNLSVDGTHTLLAELAPFFLINFDQAPLAYAEYLLYCQNKQDCNTDWVHEQVEHAVKRAIKGVMGYDPILTYAFNFAFFYLPQWYLIFIDDDLKEELQRAIQQRFTSLNH